MATAAVLLLLLPMATTTSSSVASASSFPVIAQAVAQCQSISSYVVASQAPVGQCTPVQLQQGSVYVMHDCSGTGLVQLFASPTCSDAPFVQTLQQPFCDADVNIGICCSSSSSSSGSGGESGVALDWPLAQCQTTSAPTASTSTCRPISKTDKKTCTSKLSRCQRAGRKMKWTGVGCKTAKKRLGDGGCQCDQYCGYGCKQACTKDKQCKWQYGRCSNRAGKTVVGGLVCQD